MDTKIMLRQACRQALSVGIGGVLVLLAASGLQAATLWNNGAPTLGTSNQTRCESGPGSCGNGPGISSAVFDNFTVGTGGWVINGFDFTDFLIDTPTNHYVNTKWSIWSTDPMNGGTPLYTGTSVAMLTQPSGYNCFMNSGSSVCVELFTITLGSPVALSSGTYYLGVTNAMVGNTDVTYRAFATGGPNSLGSPTTPLPGFEQGTYNNATQTWTYTSSVNGDSAFDIIGYQAPEPGTLVLMSFALAGLGFLRRRRTA